MRKSAKNLVFEQLKLSGGGLALPIGAYGGKLPDHYCTSIDIPAISGRYLRIEIDDQGCLTEVYIELPLFAAARRIWLWGNKDIKIEDAGGNNIQPIGYHIKVSRKRASGSNKIKYLSITPGSKNRVSANPSHVFEHYDLVAAIDTNTKGVIFGEDHLSVVGIATSSLSPLAIPKIAHINFSKAIEFRNLAEPREKLGWLYSILALIDFGIIKNNMQVLLIVDAYMNEIMNINDGFDLIPNQKMPKNIKLAYASSDTAQDFLVNKCVKCADDVAKTVLEKILEEKNLHELRSNSKNQDYRAIRFWELTDDGRSMRGTFHP